MTDKQNKEGKEDFRLGNVKVDPVKRVAFPVFSNFPADKWLEYNKDVDQNWGSVRWAKAFHDHEVAKQSRREEAIWEMVLGLKEDISLLKKSSEEVEDDEEEDKIPTLGSD